MIGFDVFFLMMGAVMVLAMHAGFAFLEVGTVRKTAQVNALVKILADFSASTVAYFFVGYHLAYGVDFLGSARSIVDAGGGQGYGLVKFFFLLTFAAAVPAIISGGIAERAKFYPQFVATIILVALVYPLFEGMAWNGNFGAQALLEETFGFQFHDFAGSVVVHAMGGWIALGAVIMLGNRKGRFRSDGRAAPMAPSNIVWLALGAWILCVGWFGFNVMSAQKLGTASGLVAVNSLMAMVGGTLSALFVSRNDPGFVHNGALAGLVAICAGSDVMHPVGALVTGALAGMLFVFAFNLCQNRFKLDDVLGVWALHGLCGTLGGLLCGIFGLEALGGLGGVSFGAQAVGTLAGISIATVAGFAVYGVLKATVGIRLSEEDEFSGPDIAIHNISSTPDQDLRGA